MRRMMCAPAAAALVASLALLGCEQHATQHAAHSRPELAQSSADGGIPGMPNPMPGSPIADAGISPIAPTIPIPTMTPPAPTIPTTAPNPAAPGGGGIVPGAPPGTPTSPGSPSQPYTSPTSN